RCRRGRRPRPAHIVPACTRQKYVAGGYEGVVYQFRAPVSYADLTFLSELPGLRYVEIDGKVADDTAVFGLAELEEAVLIVRCPRPLPKIGANGMSRLVLFGDRPGLERISKLSELHDLTVWGWKGQDLSFLRGCKSLTKLKIEADRHL